MSESISALLNVALGVFSPLYCIVGSCVPLVNWFLDCNTDTSVFVGDPAKADKSEGESVEWSVCRVCHVYRVRVMCVEWIGFCVC